MIFERVKQEVERESLVNQAGVSADLPDLVGDALKLAADRDKLDEILAIILEYLHRTLVQVGELEEEVKALKQKVQELE